MPNYPINKLITDFDETVSEMDTIRLLTHAAADNRATLGEREQFLANWQEMVEWYSTRYGRILDEWLIRGDEETRGKGEKWTGSPFHVSRFTFHALLTDFLKSFEALEQASLRRVMDKKFLVGLTKDQLRKAGQKIVKLPGVERVLSAMRASGVGIEILSANWSHTLIEGAMEGLCNQIVTNDLVFDSGGHSTGQILMRVVSAQDKLHHFKEQRAKTGRTLYIGDSISDFLALLEADLGVLIGENSIARQTIERFHIPTISIRHADRFHPKIHKQGTIRRVDSWEGLNRFLKAE